MTTRTTNTGPNRRTMLRTGAALAAAPAAVASAPSIVAQLRGWIVGQDTAITAVSAAIERVRRSQTDGQRPAASFLFLGPAGVGKTHLAKAAAEVAFGTRDALTRIDMRRATDLRSLVDTLRLRARQVALFDEADKAQPEALGWLKSLLQTGRLDDAHGHVADLRDSFAVTTTLRLTASLGFLDELTQSVTFRPLTPAQRAEVARRMSRGT